MAQEEAAKENGDKPRNVPRCPECKREIEQFTESQVTLLNGLIVHMLWCANDECRALFVAQIVGQVQRRPEAKRIVMSSLVPINPTRKQ